MRQLTANRHARLGSTPRLVPILMYHAVGTPRDRRFAQWVVSSGSLEAQLRALRQAGYAIVGLTEWALQPTVQKTAVVTFDDGYKDFVEQALPILKQVGARATLYVTTGYIGHSATWLPFAAERDRPMMTWDDVRAAEAEGVEIGSHGHMHIELDVVPAEAALRDILTSRDALVGAGLEPCSFAYPYGYVDKGVQRMVAAAGFSTACTVGDGLFRTDRDQLSIRRLIVDDRTSPERLLRRLGGPETGLRRRLIEAGRGPWREVRRAKHWRVRVA